MSATRCGSARNWNEKTPPPSLEGEVLAWEAVARRPPQLHASHPSPVDSQGSINWPSVLEAWKTLGYCEPYDCVSAALLSTWKSGTRDAYASHLRRLAQLGGTTPWKDAQRVAELALFGMFKLGYRQATLRGCVSAVKACVLLGWLPELKWDRLWRITKAPVDAEVHRPYGGADVLQLIAEACSSEQDWIRVPVELAVASAPIPPRTVPAAWTPISLPA